MTRLAKAARQHLVGQLLAEQSVSSQSQLVELLRAAGEDVNQATVSRDLDELGAVKVRAPGGEAVYAIPEMPFQRAVPSEHLRRVLADWVAGVSRSGDLIVVRTPPGCAHVVASAIDRSILTDVIGTVAGDDTLLVVAAEQRGADIEVQLNALANPDAPRTGAE